QAIRISAGPAQLSALGVGGAQGHPATRTPIRTRSGAPAGRLFGQPVATAPAVYLVQRYSSPPPGLRRDRGGMPRAYIAARSRFTASFAADVNPDLSAFIADSQVPWGVNALGGTVTQPAPGCLNAGIATIARMSRFSKRHYEPWVRSRQEQLEVAAYG